MANPIGTADILPLSCAGSLHPLGENPFTRLMSTWEGVQCRAGADVQVNEAREVAALWFLCCVCRGPTSCPMHKRGVRGEGRGCCRRSRASRQDRGAAVHAVCCSRHELLEGRQESFQKPEGISGITHTSVFTDTKGRTESAPDHRNH